MRMRIEGGRALVGGSLEETSVDLDCEGGVVTGVGAQASAERVIDARGFVVLPGIVDVHGDAFERQMMPRPGVGFPIDVALLESDRQAVANGITTVFHGVTWSWEGGLRGAENARAILDGIERLRPRLGADTRYHLRHETYNLDAEAEIMTWLARRRIDAIAFNDHMSGTATHRAARNGSSRKWPSAPAPRTSASWRWWSAPNAGPMKSPLRSSGSPRPPTQAAFRCCRTTTPVPNGGDGFARSGAAWRNSRPRSRPPRTPHPMATISCSAPPTSFAVEATPDGSTRPR